MLTALLRNLGWLEAVFSWTGPVSRDGSFYLDQRRSNCLFIQRVDRSRYIIQKLNGDPSECYLLWRNVGVLAATSMSNPAYKAVLDSSPISNSPWEMMKLQEKILPRKCCIFGEESVDKACCWEDLYSVICTWTMVLKRRVLKSGEFQSRKEKKNQVQLLIVSKKISASFNDCAQSF